MSNVNHKSRRHAILSASGSSRWLNCTPSAILEDKHRASYPEKPSVYALEGTLAHEYSDILLRFALGEIPEKVKNKEIKKLEKDKLFSLEMPEMVGIYVDYVLQLVEDLKREHDSVEVLIEERLDYSHIVEKGFGTGDVTIVADDILFVIDLKYGKGIKVEAIGNSQTMLYGSGALRMFDLVYDIETVRMIIVQPRLDHVSQWDISTETLRDWGEKHVKPLAKKAIKGEGEKVAGHWCRFCKVAAMCNTLAEENIKLAKHEFADPHLLDDDTIVQIYGQAQMLNDWVNSVSRFMLDTAIGGKKWKGFKLVEGRSNRKWDDDEKVIEIMKSKRYPQKEYMTKKLKGITALEKLIGKKDFHDVLGEQIIKPQGAPTLAALDDPRPAYGIEQAKLDFAD